jgi:hypothetical protein
MAEIKACHIYDDEGIFFKHLASWRLRVDIPKAGLRKLGIKSYGSVKPEINAVNIFHKHFIREAPELMEKYGGIYDVVDDHFTMEDSEYYKEMCMVASLITTSTEKMKTRIKDETGKDANVIWDSYDPTQYIKRPPEYKNTKSICWFGSETNLQHLRDMKIPCRGDLVTHSGLQSFAQKDMRNILKQGWNYIPWVNGIMPNIFKRHDIVIIPYGNTFKQHAKSPNRIVDALRSGMIVVTNDSPVVDSYGLRDFCVVSNDISKGIESVWLNPDNAIKKVIKGQSYIETNLSPDIIAGQWAKVIREC